MTLKPDLPDFPATFRTYSYNEAPMYAQDTSVYAVCNPAIFMNSTTGVANAMLDAVVHSEVPDTVPESIYVPSIFFTGHSVGSEKSEGKNRIFPVSLEPFVRGAQHSFVVLIAEYNCPLVCFTIVFIAESDIFNYGSNSSPTAHASSGAQERVSKQPDFLMPCIAAT